MPFKILLQRNAAMDKKCFDAVVDKKSKLLILGSFPSEISLKANFYYGNKNNRFWNTLAEYFCETISDKIESKKAFLAKHNIALWDIIKETSLKGSSDLLFKKENYFVNNIADLLQNHPKIKAIFCNGKTSFDIARKHFPQLCFVYLPSTSPANVSFSKELWFKALDNVFK